MMYSEFIENSNFTEHYISYAEYTTYIEPIYMGAEQIPTKQEFITLLQDTFKTLCHPVVERAIHNSTTKSHLLNADHNRYRNILQE